MASDLRAPMDAGKKSAELPEGDAIVMLSQSASRCRRNEGTALIQFTPNIAKRKETFSTAFLLVLAGYFLLQIGIRTLHTGALELDEAEQVFNAQQILPGYDGQPPLYTWLQSLFFAVFGVNLLGLAALKNALLFLLYASMFFVARPLVGPLGAGAVSSSLVLFVQLGWEAQIDRTHSVLVTTLAAFTLWMYSLVLRRPDPFRYAMLGLALGLGMQAKYNFGIFALGLTAASLLAPEHRRTVWSRHAWIAAAVACLCLLPHGIWFIDNLDAATEETLRKMGADGEDAAGYVRNVASGFGDLLLGFAAFTSPIWIAFAVVARHDWKIEAIATPHARFFLYLYIAMTACIVALVFSGRLANIKARWLQPMFFSLPLALFVFFPSTAKGAVYRKLLCVTCAVALAILIALSLRPRLEAASGKSRRVHQPFPELAAGLARKFPHVRLVAVQDRQTGGNLRFHHPRLSALLLSDVFEQPAAIRGHILLLVRSGSEPAWLDRLHRTTPDANVLEEGKIEAISPEHEGHTLLFDYALVRMLPRTGMGSVEP
ncbi:hypothetical protein EGT07_01650 [Herbaspirillum sp. HC18]|nr:hypothetical protein EGT07_01650 [Herbaspirillum sp. HC18]